MKPHAFFSDKNDRPDFHCRNSFCDRMSNMSMGVVDIYCNNHHPHDIILATSWSEVLHCFHTGKSHVCDDSQTCEDHRDWNDSHRDDADRILDKGKLEVVGTPKIQANPAYNDLCKIHCDIRLPCDFPAHDGFPSDHLTYIFLELNVCYGFCDHDHVGYSEFAVYDLD